MTTGSVCPLKKGGDKRSIFRDVHKQFIKDLINDDCTISLKVISEKLLENFNIKASKQCISDTISNFNYSMKCITVVPQARNSPQNIEKRYE